jgi:tripartite-type tricarboxylate transporter receptor subunit TctC
MRANGILRRKALLGLAGACFLPAIARAQAYPSRPVRVIVPFSAGGNTDIMARIIMPHVAEQLGQPFVVENRPSASTVVGNEAVAKAQPDGYTLLAVDTTLAVLPTLQPRLPFDIFRDFAPISTLVSAPTTLVVRASLPARSLQDVIALAKAQPGRLSYATGSIGGTAHLAALLFQEEAGISLLHAPYSGAGQAMTDLVGGHLDITFSALAAVTGLVEAGSVRAIATSGAERVPIAPDLPTFRESGLPNVVVSAHWGLYAPAGTPAPIIERLSAAAVAAVREPAITAELERRGYVIVGGSAADQARILREEHDKWGAVMRRTGSVPG